MSPLESLARRIEGATSLDTVADYARSSAHDKLVAPPALDALLGGSWLGHRVHPALMVVPLGAWTSAVLLQVVDKERHAASVESLLLTGCLTALPTAVTGAHDYGTTSGDESRVGIVHAASMEVALGFFAGAWVKHRRGDRRAARRLALWGAAAAGAGAYLGGHLSYRLGVGVED